MDIPYIFHEKIHRNHQPVIWGVLTLVTKKTFQPGQWCLSGRDEDPDSLKICVNDSRGVLQQISTRKTIGKPWNNGGLMGFNGDLPSGNLT